MTRLQHIEVVREFPVPVSRLFAHLAEHENLAKLFAPATAERIRDGDEARNGIGSARRLRVWPARSFVETVTAYRENELIEYRITEGSPLRDHFGRLRFTDLGPDRSRLDYTIAFRGTVPGLGPAVRIVLERGIVRGLSTLALQ